MISVIVLSKNGAGDLARCLNGIKTQRVEQEVEVVVVDSGSTDASAELAEEWGARMHRIEPDQFNHGTTRNLGVSLASGDIVVFTSQDAYAESPDWLATLTAPLESEPHVAGVYGRQVAQEDAKPPERFFLEFLYGPDGREQRADSVEELSMETTLFSNANSAIRRELIEKHPFVEDMIMSEDQEWSRRMLLAGWAVRYEPRAAVRHSHPYTVRRAFKRFFDSGVSADRAYLAGARPSKRVLRREAMRYAREEVLWLWRNGYAAWLPYAAVYELAKFAGLVLGTRHGWLPDSLKVRFSGMPAYWS